MVFKALEWNGNPVRLGCCETWLVVGFWLVDFLVLCLTARPFNSAQKKKILRPPGELKDKQKFFVVFIYLSVSCFLDSRWAFGVSFTDTVIGMVSVMRHIHLGMAMGRGGAEGWGLRPRPAWFCLATSPPRPAWRGILSHPNPAPWGPHEPPPHLVKLYFLLICPTTSTIFLMKPISLIKIYLKLQLNLSH